MTTKFSKWILYLSSYIPLYIIFIISNLFDVYGNYELLKINGQYNFKSLISLSKVNIILIILFISLTLISLILLITIINIIGRGSEYVNLYEIKKNNKSINEYILVYILPFITVKTNDYKELTIFMLVFMLIGVLAVKNDLVYINPILYIMKFNIYSFKENNYSLEESILISKYSIVEIKNFYMNNSSEIVARASKLAEGVYYIPQILKNNETKLKNRE